MKIHDLRILLILLSFQLFSAAVYAQEKFDVTTFSVPKGWTKEVSPNGDAVRFSKEDSAKNAFAMITIFKSIPAGADSKVNFNEAWSELAEKTLNAKSPKMNPAINQNGWETQTGLAEFQKDGLSGIALLTTASAENKMVNILLVTNTDIYQKEIENFFASVKLPLVAKSSEMLKPANNSNGNSTANLTGSVNDYEFVVPPTWTRQNFANEIVLRKNSEYVISFQPFTVSGGNLENDAEKIFWQVFQGWQQSTSGGYDTYEKGKTKQGLNYFLVKKFITKQGTLGRDGILLLVQVGDKIAVISASQPYNDIARSSLEALDFILFDFGIKGIGMANFQKELQGSWSSASSTVGVITTYHPNNTFSSGGVSQTRTSRDATTDIITTKGFASDGNYSLSGNLLIKNFTKTKVIHKSKIRFYYTKHNNDEWVFKMGSQGLTVSGISVFTKD